MAVFALQKQLPLTRRQRRALEDAGEVATRRLVLVPPEAGTMSVYGVGDQRFIRPSCARGSSRDRLRVVRRSLGRIRTDLVRLIGEGLDVEGNRDEVAGLGERNNGKSNRMSEGTE